MWKVRQSIPAFLGRKIALAGAQRIACGHRRGLLVWSDLFYPARFGVSHACCEDVANSTPVYNGAPTTGPARMKLGDEQR
jgi:hypothetical protein